MSEISIGGEEEEEEEKVKRSLGTQITQYGTRVRARRNYGDAWAKTPVHQRPRARVLAVH